MYIRCLWLSKYKSFEKDGQQIKGKVYFEHPFHGLTRHLIATFLKKIARSQSSFVFSRASGTNKLLHVKHFTKQTTLECPGTPFFSFFYIFFST